MKVIAIFDFIISPLSIRNGVIKYGETYTVKSRHYGYSTFAKRWIDAYELYETDGLWEHGIFMPLSDIDETRLHSEPNHEVIATQQVMKN